jgi:hypothetical protein
MNKDRLRKIESFKDIEFEKKRLKYIINLTEEKIDNNFNALSNKLNINYFTSRIKEGFLGKTYEFIKLFRIGYDYFANKNKKK